MIIWSESTPGVDDEPVDLGRAWTTAVWLTWTTVLVVIVTVAAFGLD